MDIYVSIFLFFSCQRNVLTERLFFFLKSIEKHCIALLLKLCPIFTTKSVNVECL